MRASRFQDFFQQPVTKSSPENNLYDTYWEHDLGHIEYTQPRLITFITLQYGVSCQLRRRTYQGRTSSDDSAGSCREDNHFGTDLSSRSCRYYRDQRHPDGNGSVVAHECRHNRTTGCRRNHETALRFCPPGVADLFTDTVRHTSLEQSSADHAHTDYHDPSGSRESFIYF